MAVGFLPAVADFAQPPREVVVHCAVAIPVGEQCEDIRADHRVVDQHAVDHELRRNDAARAGKELRRIHRERLEVGNRLRISVVPLEVR
jgi:hypothetical protein